MGKLVSAAGVCVSMTRPSVAPGLGFDRDVAVNDADPGRRVSSTARQEKNISPDPAQNCLIPTEQEVVSLCASLSVFWASGNGLSYWLKAHQFVLCLLMAEHCLVPSLQVWAAPTPAHMDMGTAQQNCKAVFRGNREETEEGGDSTETPALYSGLPSQVGKTTIFLAPFS